MLLNKIQTAIFMELSIAANANKPLHGYQIIKLIGERGIEFSHQQLYRSVDKMDLICKVEPVFGKPDRKMYSLRKNKEYTFDESKFSTDFLLAYPNKEWIKNRIEIMTDEKGEIERSIAKLIREGKENTPAFFVKTNEVNRAGLDIIELAGVLQWVIGNE